MVREKKLKIMWIKQVVFIYLGMLYTYIYAHIYVIAIIKRYHKFERKQRRYMGEVRWKRKGRGI